MKTKMRYKRIFTRMMKNETTEEKKNNEKNNRY